MSTRKQPPRKEGRCAFFIARKWRYCTQPVPKGAELCVVHHAPAEGEPESKHGKRVPCPLNPNHSVYESRLSKHLRKCNAKRKFDEMEARPYYSAQINAGAPAAGQEHGADGHQAAAAVKETRLFDFSFEEQNALIARLDDLLGRVGAAKDGELLPELRPLVQVSEEQLRLLAAAAEAKQADEGKTSAKEGDDKAPPSENEDKVTPSDKEGKPAAAKVDRPIDDLRGGSRHSVQERAIVACVKSALGTEALGSGSCFVEMGAGKAGLSHCISAGVPAGEEASFVMVDRQSMRNHHGAAIAQEEKRQVERVRIDIRDLDLWKVPLVESFLAKRPPAASLAVVSKHLCGDATCLTLRCVSRPGPNAALPDVITIALCCHHRCTLGGYVNPALFLETLGLDARQFDMIRRLSSWATCGFERQVRAEAAQAAGAGAAAAAADGAAADLSATERIAVGLKCKLLLNYGRVLFLREQGFEASLEPFVSRAATLENTILVARRRRQRRPA